MIKNVAELKRLPVGTDITMVSITSGTIPYTTNKVSTQDILKLEGIPRKNIVNFVGLPRKIVKKQTNGIWIGSNEINKSWLEYPKADEFVPTENGFILVELYGNSGKTGFIGWTKLEYKLN